MKHLRSATIVALSALALGACKKKTPAESPTPDAGVETSASEQARADTLAAERMRLEQERAATEAATARVRETLTEIVYFDYDSENLSAEAEEELRTKAAILRENPEVTLRIAGHADARGSTEYNLALAQRRAESVRDFLGGYGIAGDRFEVISYGKEQPRVEGDTEDAYAQNRRAEFVVTGGEASLGSASLR